MVILFVSAGVAALAVLGGLHWYAWRRLVRDTTSGPGPVRRLGTALFVAGPLLMVGAIVSERAGAPFPLQQTLSWPGFLWMPLGLYLVLALLAGEFVRPVLRRALERRAARRAESGGAASPAATGPVASTEPAGSVASTAPAESTGPAEPAQSGDPRHRPNRRGPRNRLIQRDPRNRRESSGRRRGACSSRGSWVARPRPSPWGPWGTGPTACCAGRG